MLIPILTLVGLPGFVDYAVFKSISVQAMLLLFPQDSFLVSLDVVDFELMSFAAPKFLLVLVV